MFKIVEKRILAPDIKWYNIYAPQVAKKARAGQFVILRLYDRGERIPLTIADYDREKGTVLVVFQEVGKTTKMLGMLDEGDEVLDFIGPLGIPFQLEEEITNVVLIGGGVGIPAIYPKAKELFEEGKKRVISIIGARNKDLLIMKEEMRAASHELLIATDDGSEGTKGFVTTVLQDLIDKKVPMDVVIAVGPPIMMKMVAKTTKPYDIYTLVSLNSIMVDGTGMCGSCRVTVDGKIKFACVDGPIFDGHKVDFDELMRRNRMYVDKEKLSLEIWEKEVQR